jgi:hypothetical protein
MIIKCPECHRRLEYISGQLTKGKNIQLYFLMENGKIWSAWSTGPKLKEGIIFSCYSCHRILYPTIIDDHSINFSDEQIMEMLL